MIKKLTPEQAAEKLQSLSDQRKEIETKQGIAQFITTIRKENNTLKIYITKQNHGNLQLEPGDKVRIILHKVEK